MSKFLKAHELTLENCGAANQFRKHMPQILHTLEMQQEGELEASGAIELTLKIKIKPDAESLKLSTRSSLKVPAFPATYSRGLLMDGVIQTMEIPEQESLFSETKIERLNKEQA